MMKKMTATEAKTRFGKIGDYVQAGPIHVTKRGKNAMVIVSAEQFDHLTALEDRLWGERALEVVRNQKTLGVRATARWFENHIENGG